MLNIYRTNELYTQNDSAVGFLFILRVGVVAGVVSPRHLLHGGLEHLSLGQNIPEHISALLPSHLKKRTKS